MGMGGNFNVFIGNRLSGNWNNWAQVPEESQLQVEVTPAQRLGTWGAEWRWWWGLGVISNDNAIRLQRALNDFPLLRDRKHRKGSLMRGVGSSPGKDTKHRARVQGPAESHLAWELRGGDHLSCLRTERWKPAELTVETGLVTWERLD